MNIFKLAFELFILYILYKLVVGFIIPVYRASKRMKEEVGNMQQKMQEQQQRQQQQANSTYVQTKATAASKPGDADYIEFEEVK